MLEVKGYDEDLARAKDINLYLKIAKLGKFGFLSECFINHSEIFWKDENAKEFIRKRHRDLFFHRKVIWRHRKDFPRFWQSYLEVNLRYWIFKVSTVFPSFYKIFRIPSVSRISLNFELNRQFKRLKLGVVLEIGPGHSSCKKYVPYTKYLTLDIDKRSKPDICSDIHNNMGFSDYFDTVIAIEVLEHLYDPQKAINEIWRILRPGGICILSTRFIHPYHPGPKDYYRFTWDSLNYLFKGFSKVEIYHHGNKIQSLWQIINDGYGKKGILLNILNPLIARISSKKTKFPLGFVVYAKK